MSERFTAPSVRAMKAEGKKITCVTAYDYPSARLVSDAGVEVLLVGDSLGMVVLGHDSTLPVTLEDMLHHTRAVTRAKPNSLVVGDLPFMTYQTGPIDALRNSGRLVQEAGADAVKLEGVPRNLAKEVTAALSIPTIGIGAGPDCDGQVLVWHDLLGLWFGRPAKFVRRYADLGGAAKEGLARFAADVREGRFPGDEESYGE